MEKAILTVDNVSKSFLLPDKSRLSVLQGVSLEVERGSIIAVTGASGSGKSTLLHLIGGMDVPDEGDIRFESTSILSFTNGQRAEYRNQKVGFVFQFHYLMPELNVLENTAFPFLMKNFDKPAAYGLAEKLLEDVGLSDKKNVMPFQLSGGERQRVAIVRSLINAPYILLADEPTGNLDWKTGEKVFQVFRRMITDRGLTAVIVTHNEKLAASVDRHYHLEAGRLY
jgi:lipoprotein-releasing system ATP-binding protein